MSKLTDFDEWLSILDHNIGSDKIFDFILFLTTVCCDNEQRLKIMRSLLELNEKNSDD